MTNKKMNRPARPTITKVDIDNLFRKSSASESTACVEVAKLPNGVVKVRDSKNPTGSVLTFNSQEWTAFLKGVEAGEFDIQL